MPVLKFHFHDLSRHSFLKLLILFKSVVLLCYLWLISIIRLVEIDLLFLQGLFMTIPRVFGLD